MTVGRLEAESESKMDANIDSILNSESITDDPEAEITNKTRATQSDGFKTLQFKVTSTSLIQMDPVLNAL